MSWLVSQLTWNMTSLFLPITRRQDVAITCDSFPVNTVVTHCPSVLVLSSQEWTRGEGWAHTPGGLKSLPQRAVRGQAGAPVGVLHTAEVGRASELKKDPW